ncbi:MAG: GIY-YIG nuclease family protein [Janthinobacterium lividum]
MNPPKLTNFAYRKKVLPDLTNEKGVYALCDLNEVPIYVGQSTKGIRERVQRHLTSARSDIIANRQIDLWEIAYVKAWPVADPAQISTLEALLFNAFNAQKTLMNGSILRLSEPLPETLPIPAQILQVMADEDIRVRLEPALRLPRQIEHIGRLVDHILNVKDSRQLRHSLSAHFSRLEIYRAAFLGAGAPVVRNPGETDD